MIDELLTKDYIKDSPFEKMDSLLKRLKYKISNILEDHIDSTRKKKHIKKTNIHYLL